MIRKTVPLALAAAMIGLAAPATASAATTAPAVVTSTTIRPGTTSPAVKTLQTRLNSLGYWVGTPTGYYGSQTSQAVMALQKTAGLTRDGIYGPMTKAALDKGIRPGSVTKVGHVIEIDKARQIMKVVDNGRVSRIYNTSTGGNYAYYQNGVRHVATTPSGTFKVWWTYPGVWQNGSLGSMYKPHYFNGGIAIHGVGSPSGVGAYGASHGCARLTIASMDELLRSGALANKGTVVKVY